MLPVKKLKGYSIAIITAHVPGQHMWVSPGPRPSLQELQNIVKILSSVRARLTLTIFEKYNHS